MGITKFNSTEGLRFKFDFMNFNGRRNEIPIPCDIIN